MDSAERLCFICKENEFKYKCPGCFMITCSIKCINTHKVEFDCSGKQEIQFKKINDFDDSQLLKDFGFLEGVSSLLDGVRRDRKSIVKSMEQLPPWLKKLVFEARCRGTRLKLLPAGFEKRIKNKTTFIYDKKVIRWDVCFIFTHITEKGNVIEKPSSLVLNRVDESRTLREILNEILNPENVMERLDIWKILTSYRLTDESKILLLLCTGKQFFEIKMDQSLTQALDRRTIIEYPTFIVTFNDSRDKFPISKVDETSDVTNCLAKKDFFGNNFTGGKKHRKQKRKRGEGFKSHNEPKVAKIDQDSSQANSIAEASKVVAIDTPTLPSNTSDVSSLSTSDDEDYQKFLNIGFAR